jgi:hypothetical protein
MFLDEPVELAMDACVVRVLGPADAPTGIAVMWTSTDAEAVSRLARLLDHLRTAAP